MRLSKQLEGIIQCLPLAVAYNYLQRNGLLLSPEFPTCHVVDNIEHVLSCCSTSSSTHEKASLRILLDVRYGERTIAEITGPQRFVGKRATTATQQHTAGRQARIASASETKAPLKLDVK